MRSSLVLAFLVLTPAIAAAEPPPSDEDAMGEVMTVSAGSARSNASGS